MTVFNFILLLSIITYSQSFFVSHPLDHQICRQLCSTAPTSIAASAPEDLINNLDFDWKEASDNVFIDDKRSVILFDGICKFCNGSVNYALDNDSVGQFRFASLQSKIGQALLIRSGKDANDHSSIVLVTEEKSYFKSDAVVRIASKLDGKAFLPIFGKASRLVPTALRNIVYDFVGRNRYRFGVEDTCRVDGEEFESRFLPDP